MKVTCRHVQWLRDQLPAFEGQPDRYVVWGEGTTDEMCLGILHGHPPLTGRRQTRWAASGSAPVAWRGSAAPTGRAAHQGLHD